MSSKILRTISFDLSTEGLNKAISEVKQFRKDLERMCQDLARNLTAEGVEIAKMQVISMDAEFTGYLEESLQGVYFAEERCGYVFTDIYYAIFVEYGTGFKGASESYPGEYPPGYQPDGMGHGAAGWWYPAPWGWYIPKKAKNAEYETGVPLAWTNGMYPRPFMLNTLRWLEEAAEREGIRMFRNYAG